MVNHYGNMIKALADLRPNHLWTPWMFKEYEKAPRNFWGDPKNQRDYLQWLGPRVGFNTMEDWYNVSKEIFRNNFGTWWTVGRNSAAGFIY